MSALAMIFLLADEDDSSSGISIFFACIFLVILVAGGAYLVIWLRRRYWGPDDSGSIGGNSHVGFTLGDLRHLHKTGQLSDEEFNRAKEKIVAAAQRAAQRDAPVAKPEAQNPPSHGQ